MTSKTKSCARAPVRVDPAGGGTDAPPFRTEYGGAVVNMAVQRHAWAYAQRLPAGSGVVISALDIKQVITSKCVDDLAEQSSMPFLAAFVRRLVDSDESVLLVTEVDVPPGSGLGGSGALGVAVTAALDDVYGRRRSAFETATIANEIERVDLGYPGGDQDSFGAALGGVNYFQYDVGGKITPHKVAIQSKTLRALESRSLLVYTGAAHVSASIHEDILRAYAQPESSTKQALFTLQEQAEAVKAALEADDLDAYAAGLNESCRQLYRLHASCDSDELRRYFSTLDAHIDAGKTCGAGGGGCIKLLVKPGHRSECIRQVAQLGGQAWPLIVDMQGLVTWKAPAFDQEFLRSVTSLPSSRDA